VRTAIKLVTLLGGGGIAYAIRDLFTTALSAGSVNGTNAEPGPGVRNVIDPLGSKVTVTGGYIHIVGTGSWLQAAFYETPAITRAAGKVCVIEYILSNTTPGRMIGLSTTTDGNFTGYNSVGISEDFTGQWGARRTSGGSTPLLMATSLLSGTLYIVLRLLGKYVFLDIGTDVILLWWDDWDSTATLYLGATQVQNGGTGDYRVRSPSSAFYAVQALASDSFNRADGALGSTDGAGHAEANSGSDKAWTDQVGTWGIATNKAQALALSGGLAVATIDAGVRNVILEMKTVRASAGNVGGVACWTDANNHIEFYHDGTNAVCKQIVAGTPTTLVTAAATYAANAKLRLMIDGTRVMLYYNDIYIGTSNSLNAGLTATVQGILTTDTGNTQDNFTCFARSGYTDLRNY